MNAQLLHQQIENHFFKRNVDPENKEISLAELHKFVANFITEEDLKKAPSINEWNYNDVEKLSDQLVHFRGMLQDEHDTEIHMYQCKCSDQSYITLFSDELPNVHEEPTKASYTDRTLFTGVKPPTASWLRADNSQIHDNSPVHPVSEKLRNACYIPSAEPVKITDRVQACILKSHSEIFHNLRINELFDFYGVLRMPSTYTEESEEYNDKQNCRLVEYLPHLHLILCRPVNMALEFEASPLNFADMRNRILADLKDILYGDRIAAELLLCALIARVKSRNDDRPVNKLALNICNVDDHCVCQLRKYLQSIIPFVCYLDIDIKSLNASRWAPRKDHQLEQLVANRLQLVDGSLVLCNETKMDNGQLNDNGVRNVKTLEMLAASQRIFYDFTYSQVPFETDYLFIIMSDTRSLIKCDICINVRRQSALIFPDQSSEECLNDLRHYLQAARHVDITIPNQLSKTMEKELAKQAHEEMKTNRLDEMHTRITLGLIIAQSRGADEMSIDDFNHGIELVRAANESMKR